MDTETTGLEVEQGHRILEVGCVEIIDRKLTHKHFHQYVNPERDIDDGAMEVHGISRDFLRDKPVFRDIWEGFLEFINGAELVIHNAAFDVAFIESEMKLMSSSIGKLTDYCEVVDSLSLARQKHPGQKNNLDALCKRYSVDNSQRELHGALLDAEILADVYLLMTGGQVSLTLGSDDTTEKTSTRSELKTLTTDRPPLKVLRANEDELKRHEEKLDQIDGISGASVWRNMPGSGS